MTAAPLSAQADDSFELTLSIIDKLNANTTGGKFGFGAKEVNGPYLLGYKTSGFSGGVFYPASTIKVLHHLTAMRWVAQHGIDALNTPIPVYTNSCAGTGQFQYEPLHEVLTKMMVDSDNRRTNAIQDHFGQAHINNVAHNVVGMGWTQLNHKFGGTCGGPDQNPHNKMIIDDIILLYERFASGELLDPFYSVMFRILMRNPSNDNIFDSLINSSFTDLGLTESQRNSFLANFNYVRKPGNWGIPDRTHESQAGFVSLPNRTCNGMVPAQYAFGAFVDDASSMTNNITRVVVRDMLRGEFRNAMRTLKPQALFPCTQGWNSILPNLGGSLIIQLAQGRTIVNIRPDSTYNKVLRLETAVLDSVDNVPHGRFDIGHGFWFGLIDAGEEVPYPYIGDAELTLHYSAKAVYGLDEYNLALYRWNEVEESWEPLSTVCPSSAPPVLDTRRKEMRAQVCETGAYALFAPPIPV